VKDKNPVSAEYKTALQNFAAASATEIFKSEKKSTNITYSPISLYMALAISASAAKNQTQDEILSVLKMKNLGVTQLESQTGNLFRLLYTDNKVGKLHLANSLWLAKGIPFNEEYLDSATKKYYASLYSVDFADAKTGDLISKWISENTNGLLQGSNPPDSQQILAIINTLYFYDEWVNQFSETQTKKDSFSLPNGQTVTTDFMNDTLMGHEFIRGEGFLSSSLEFKNGSSMNFYLPDKGVDVYDLLSTPEKVNQLLDPAQGQNVRKHGRVVFKIPKFAYGTNLPLNDVLKNMGMKQAFEPNADFSGLTTATSAYISKVLQETYISINEKGCEAAAYTQISMVTSAPAPSEDYAEMILDRPFIYTITSPDDVVLFMGVINNPISE
jgi:serpin B